MVMMGGFMRLTRWLIIIGIMLLTVPAASLAQEGQDTAERKVLSLVLVGQEETSGEDVPLAHFFIEPESGAWGKAGGWAYWEPKGGWYFHHDEADIYRVQLLTGQTRKLTNLPKDITILRTAVSPDGQWIAFLTINGDNKFTAYAVRTD